MNTETLDRRVRKRQRRTDYRVLFLEDNPDDVELILHELAGAGLEIQFARTDKKDQFISVIREFKPDVILADYSLTHFNGLQAFQMMKEEGMNLPFILVTGVLSEQMAIQCLKDGVDDFVLKSNFKRLPPAIISAVERKTVEREKVRMAAALEKSYRELRLLINRQQISIEEERMSIARDLHDELGQVLTALKIELMLLWKKTATKLSERRELDIEFEGIVGLIDKITVSVKGISSGLRPEMLDELGLFEALRNHASEFERRNEIRCRTELPENEPELGRDISIGLFRIIQEALTNVARHSMATEVGISVRTDENKLNLEIRDNGKGIDAEEVNDSKSLGIIGIRERVRLLEGDLRIGLVPGGGTVVSVEIPLKD